MDFRFPQRTFICESRPLDYVYDHVYTTSNTRDFYTVAAMGSRQASEIKFRPIYKSMFSEIVGDRRIEACLLNKQPCLTNNVLPPCDFEGLTKDCSTHCRKVDVTGADRALFALRYESDAIYKLAPPVSPFNMEDEIRNVKKSNMSTGIFLVNRGVQSDYRESETQTDPYTPPFILSQDDSSPRILALINLTWGKGLPPTLDDIVSIERALAHHLAETSKNSKDEDDEEFLKRTRLIGELETQLWTDREKQLEKIMSQKFEIMKRMHCDIKAKIASVSTTRLERVLYIEKQKNAMVLTHIRNKYLRELRNLERKYCKRVSVSRVDSVLARDGYGGDDFEIDKLPFRKFRHFREHDFEIMKNVDIFSELTSSKSFEKKYLDFDCQKFTNCVMKAQPSQRNRRLEEMLEDVFNSFRLAALKKPDTDATSIMKEMIKKQIRRVPTPSVTGPSIAEEMTEHAVMLLQKVIRGRTVQTMMREEIRVNASTLADMKALHRMDPIGLKATFGEVEAVRLMQKGQEAQMEKENEVSEITDQLEGEVLGQQLNFLDKEMIRLQDERKIHALLILAERERRMREAIEAGRRQQEEDERRIRDEIFRKVVGIYDCTVDMYLEDMYLNSIERTADENSRAYVQNLAATVNEATYLTQKSELRNNEEMAADIVHSFLIPEMNRIYQRQRLEALKNRYLRASNDVAKATCTAQGVVRDIIDSLAPTIEMHYHVGEAAVDGTQVALNEIIKEAVQQALQPSSQSQETDEIHVSKYSVEETISETETETNVVVEPIPVDMPCFKAEMGLKSIEVTTGTEIGIDAVNLFLAAKHVTCEVFENTKKLIDSCFEEDEVDEELGSDDFDDDTT